MPTIITFNATSLASVMTYVDTLFTDMNLIIILAIGLPLGFWVIRKVISLIRVR
ncbi:unnamed protein product [marine sediment metagenome]|uniref:Uncharacterized protein n=1 Tax=marine sediment metagenome TaxID=412755 RepID=X1JM68_9ZZZZ